MRWGDDSQAYAEALKNFNRNFGFSSQLHTLYTLVEIAPISGANRKSWTWHRMSNTPTPEAYPLFPRAFIYNPSAPSFVSGVPLIAMQRFYRMLFSAVLFPALAVAQNPKPAGDAPQTPAKKTTSKMHTISPNGTATDVTLPFQSGSSGSRSCLRGRDWIRTTQWWCTRI